MENDRISYTYSEKISSGAGSFESKSISVSYSKDIPEGVTADSVFNTVEEYVHDKFKQQKAIHCANVGPVTITKNPPPDPANYNDPRNYPQAPMPTQPGFAPTGEISLPQFNQEAQKTVQTYAANVPVTPQAHTPAKEVYVPVAKGWDYVIKCKPHYGKTIKQLESEGGLQGFYDWAVKALANDTSGKPSFGLTNFVKQAQPLIEAAVPSMNPDEGMPF